MTAVLRFLDSLIPAARRAFLMIWAMGAVACGLSTLVLAGLARWAVVPEGIIVTLICTICFFFWRGLFAFMKD